MNLSINEKFKGLLFGYAIGDALGLGTEFMTRKEVKQRYPEGLHNYSQIIRDAHRSAYRKGEWTNDTETILLLIESIADNGRIDFLDYARRLKAWFLSGPTDLTKNLRLNLSQPEYSSKPFESARRVWSARNRMEPTSECLGRALIAAIWNDNPSDNALKACCMTHPESRCETSSLILAKMANSLFWENEEASYESLLDIAKEHNREVTDYVEIARHGSLADLELDDEDTNWFVRKALGAALWAVWHCNSFEKGLDAIVEQGGDADTNACLAGALLGIKYGYSSLPQHLVDGLTGKERLLNISGNFIEALTEKFC